MKPELYVVLMRNDQNEKCAVLFLADNPTDAQYKAKRYANKINGVIIGAYHAPDVNDILIMKDNRRTKKGN